MYSIMSSGLLNFGGGFAIKVCTATPTHAANNQIGIVIAESFTQDQGVFARRIKSPIGRPTTTVVDARMTRRVQSNVSAGPMCFLNIANAVMTKKPTLAT